MLIPKHTSCTPKRMGFALVVLMLILFDPPDTCPLRCGTKLQGLQR